MAMEETKTNRLINAACVWVIWWPAIFFTLFTYYQYVKLYILVPYSRSLGLAHPSDLSTGELLYVFTDTLFIAGIVIPLITFLSCYFINLKVAARFVLAGSLFFAFLSYLSLMSISNTGTLLTWELFTDSIHQGLSDPELASHYVSVSSVLKLVIIMASIICAWLVVNYVNRRALTLAWQKMLGIAVLGFSLILPSAYLYANLSTDSEVKPGLNFFKQQLVTLFQIEDEGGAEFDGLDLDQSISLFSANVKAPVGQSDTFYAGKELESNLIIISLETGPQKVINFNENKSFKYLRELAEKSFVAQQHYSTYPYTSDALFSMLGSLYPNNLRRNLFTENSLAQNNNLDAKRLGLFNALSRSGYLTNVYLPEESPFTPDRIMFSVFGANKIIIPKQEDISQAKWGDLLQATVKDFPHYASINQAEKLPFERMLTNDLASLDQMLADIKRMARAGEKFSSLFLPSIGHGPWPNQMPDATLLETGAEIFLLQDQWIGQILQTLEEEGIADNTVIVVTADHGLRTSAEYPNLALGVLNEVSFHVPLIIYAPNTTKEKIDINYLSSHIDIAPTILSLLGIDEPLIYMLGRPVWDKRIANRRTYFLANDYSGVDGYFENEKFNMYHAMTNTVVVSDHMFLQGSAGYMLKETQQESIEKVKSNIAFQRSFQGVLKRYFLDSE